MSFLSDLFGEKPVYPDIPQLSLPEEQQKAADANLAIAPKAKELSDLTADQLHSLATRLFPNLDEVSGIITGNIGREVRGLLPDSDVAAGQRSSVARGFNLGIQDGPSLGNLVLRDLGIEQQQQIDRGLRDAESWLTASERLYAPALGVYTSMFVSPEQMYSVDSHERDLQWQLEKLRADVKAMPDPTTVGLWNASWSVVDAVLSAYTGSNVTLGQIDPKGSGGSPQGVNFGGGQNAIGSNNSAYGWGYGGGQDVNINLGTQSGVGGGMDMSAEQLNYFGGIA